MFVVLFTVTQNRWRIDDVLGVWPLHGVCGAWGGIAAGIFGATAWAASAASPSARNSSARCSASLVALAGGGVVYGVLKATMGLRLDPEEEFSGADLAIHKISATADRETAW